MKIKITGSSGFIGQNLLSHFAINDKINLIPCLRSEYNHVDFKGINGIIHLAGIAHDIKNHKESNSYIEVNFELTKRLFNQFLISDATIFIFVSSVKAACDQSLDLIDETCQLKPLSLYGNSKRLAEEFILSCKIPSGKRVFILRPCMIYGENNKGNLDLLIKYIKTGLPWPLGGFNNLRSYCSIINFSFVVDKILNGVLSEQGIYNVADSELLSTNDIVKIISDSLSIKTKIYSLPKVLILLLAKIGDWFYLPLNSHRLNKLTETFIVSNKKLIDAIGEPLPVTTETGLKQIFNLK